VSRLAAERREREARRRFTVARALADPAVLLLSGVYFGLVAANYGVTFFVPQIVQAFGFSNLQTGFVSAVPYAVGAVAMLTWPRRSDRVNERRMHTALPLAVTAGGLAAAALGVGAPWTIGALAITTAGIYAAFPVFWALPTAFLSGPAAAGGIALINSIGNLSGFVGPYAMGWFKETTGSYTGGLLVLSACAAAAALLVGFGTRRDHAGSR
jgi:cyanate permease